MRNRRDVTDGLQGSSTASVHEPIVSVVVATLNRRDMLVRALASLLRQDLQEGTFEVIVVDNGSTDDTAGVVKQLLKDTVQLRYV